MTESILLIISLAACLSSGVLRKMYTNRLAGNPFANQVFNFITSVSATIVLLCWGGFSGFSWFTFFLAIAFGVCTALQQVSMLKAMDCGPWSYTSVIIALSTLIPALSGVLIWKESLHWAQIIGIILMVFCFLLSVDMNKETKAASVKWLIWCVIAFLCTGFIGVMQKWHQSSAVKLELNTFLIFAFMISSVYSLASCIVIKRNSMRNLSFKKAFFGEEKIEQSSFILKKEVILLMVIMVVTGVGCAINNKLNLYLSGIMDSAVFFPIFNGGNLVLTTVLARVLFKEKLSYKQWIGLIIGIISVLFLANPFA
ncbi:MAG: EamA family transporter [Clostridia bacterium]|nr:EamA family transporter [Clostridia bacterium]